MLNRKNAIIGMVVVASVAVIAALYFTAPQNPISEIKEITATNIPVQPRDEVTVVIAGSSGGTFNIVSRIVAEGLKLTYSTVNIVPAGSCQNGVVLLSKAEGPTVAIWEVNYAAQARKGLGACDMNIEESFVDYAWVSTMRICGRADAEASWETFTTPGTVPTIGVYRNDQDPMMNALASDLGKKFKLVPYKSSGDKLRGIAAGDIQYMYEAGKRAHAGMKDGLLNCFATTETTPREGMVQLGVLFPNNPYGFHKQVDVWIQKNMTEEEVFLLKEALRTANKTPEMQKFLSSAKATIPTGTQTEKLNAVTEHLNFLLSQ